MTEHNDLTRPLIDALNQTGGYALRMNSGKVKVARGFVQLHEEGTADILFFPRCINKKFWPLEVPVWIETKTPTGKTAKERIQKQAEFRAKVEALGHRYILAKTINEGLEALR
jgi:hypothetical protein